MKLVRRPLVIGNWKMHPDSVAAATKLAKDLKKSLGRSTNANIVVAPPYLYLGLLKEILGTSAVVQVGSQDAFPEQKGSYTGQISIPMLHDIGVTYVILGHSERRALGETDVMVQTKLAAVIKAGLTGVVCVGEQERDVAAHYLSFIEDQVRGALAGMSKSKLDRVVIAYEPLWAIGSGQNASPADVLEMKLFIERILSDMYGRAYAHRVRILYGGSVQAKNAAELYTGGSVDGFLVGGASLKATEFTGIVHTVTKI